MKLKPGLNLYLLSFTALLALAFSIPKTDNQQLNDNRKNRPLKICVISDLNSSYGSTTYSEDVKNVIGKLGSIRPDIILCAGDMVAGQKASLTEENINEMWAGFKSTVLNPTSELGIPFGFTVGNHDASPSYKLDRAISERFWKENVNAAGLTFV